MSATKFIFLALRRAGSCPSRQENVMRALLLFFLPGIFVCPASLASAETSSPETVVVTATRTPQPASVTGTSISVITSEDLAEQQTDIASDILAETPGLTINRSGGPGQPTSASLQGAESGQTVVLIDGVRVNDPSATDEGAVLGDLLVNNVDRIEVLRGPQSTLYGSDAIGGVINVISKRGGDTPFSLLATVEGGALDTAHVNLAANGATEHVEYGLGLNFFDTRSVSAADSRNGNTEPDPYRHFGATANTRTHITDTLSVDLRGYYVRARASFDDNFSCLSGAPICDSPAYNDNELYVGYAGINLDLFDGKLHNRIAIMATSSTRQFFNSHYDPGNLNFEEFGDVLRLEYQGILDLTDSDEITFGAETQRSAFRSNDYFGSSLYESDTGTSRISGYYLQGQHRFFDQLTLTGGVRLDDDDQFGTHSSAKLAAAWQIPGWGTTLRGNYGDGFKAPSLFEEFSVYSPPSGVPALKPETAKGWEIGADQPFLDGRVRASLTYFERNTSNLIDFFTCFSPSDGPGCPSRYLVGGYYYNVGRTRATGAEAEIAANVTDTLKLTANYTNLTSIDRATGLPLARRPHIEANALLFWTPTSQWSVGGGVTYVGHRFDDAGATIPLPGTILFNIYGNYRLTETYELFARVENLLDKHYEPVFGYGAPGRTAYAGLRVRI
jgi:vitamin B12 transporter